MTMCDLALWLRASSPEPDYTLLREIPASCLLLDAVHTLMRELREPYLFKAASKTPYSIERLYRLSLTLDLPAPTCSARDCIAPLWLLIEQEGVDPVTVDAHDALEVLRACAASDPSSLFARWCASALAADDRLFADYWNNRRASIARAHFCALPESEVSHVL